MATLLILVERIPKDIRALVDLAGRLVDHLGDADAFQSALWVADETSRRRQVLP